MENKIWSNSDDEFVDLVKKSLNIKEVLFKLELTTTGNSWGYSEVKRRMEALGLSYRDFRNKNISNDNCSKKKISNEVLFSSHCKHARNIVRKRIIQDNLLDYKCAICGVSEWNEKKISLELDHINGINYDNRLENLRFLCPNCHSQTSTYGSRNQQLNQSEYEITSELEELIVSEYNNVHNIKKVSKNLGIRLTVVKQVIKEESLNKSNQRYIIQYDENKNEINRFGSINEAAQYLIDSNLVTTRLLKTARNTFLRNIDKFYCNSYWQIMDA